MCKIKERSPSILETLVVLQYNNLSKVTPVGSGRNMSVVLNCGEKPENPKKNPSFRLCYHKPSHVCVPIEPRAQWWAVRTCSSEPAWDLWDNEWHRNSQWVFPEVILSREPMIRHQEVQGSISLSHFHNSVLQMHILKDVTFFWKFRHVCFHGLFGSRHDQEIITRP